MSLIIVLVLLGVMVVGGISLARMTEIGVLAAGNAAYREAALQASEVGLNDAFARVKTLASEDVADGAWYRPTYSAVDDLGAPVAADWSTAPEVVIGGADQLQYSVRYFVERMCEGAMPPADPLRQCLVKQIPQTVSADAAKEKLDPPNSRQFRITVRVVGPRGTSAFIQSLVTKG